MTVHRRSEEPRLSRRHRARLRARRPERRLQVQQPERQGRVRLRRIVQRLSFDRRRGCRALTPEPRPCLRRLSPAAEPRIAVGHRVLPCKRLHDRSVPGLLRPVRPPAALSHRRGRSSTLPIARCSAGPSRPLRGRRRRRAARSRMQWAARVNEAYRALRDPSTRAIPAVAARHRCADETDTALPLDFLEQQLERREAVGRRAATRRRSALERCSPRSARHRSARCGSSARRARRRVGDWRERTRIGARAPLPASKLAADVDTRARGTATRRNGLAADLRARCVAAAAPAAACRRHRSRHDQFAGRDGAQRRARVLPRRRRPRRCCRRSCATRAAGVDSRLRGAGRRRRAIRTTPSSRSSVSWAAGSPTSPTRADFPTFRRRARHGAASRRAPASRRRSKCRPKSCGRCASRGADALGGESIGAVITVPAYFDDAQRQATKDAARARRPERAAPAERADGRRDRLWPRQRVGRHLRRLRPRRRHVRPVDPASSRAACSKCSRPAATPRSAATISIIASICWCSSRRASRRSSREDTRACCSMKSREAKENLSDARVRADRRDDCRAATASISTLAADAFARITRDARAARR